jgi:hypothetical protein
MIASIPKWLITTSRRQAHLREEMSDIEQGYRVAIDVDL